MDTGLTVIGRLPDRADARFARVGLNLDESVWLERAQRPLQLSDSPSLFLSLLSLQTDWLLHGQNLVYTLFASVFWSRDGSHPVSRAALFALVLHSRLVARARTVYIAAGVVHDEDLATDSLGFSLDAHFGQ
ncbi:hypothetical protein HDU91_001146, partial [Kappamyces sp. JEL0680]